MILRPFAAEPDRTSQSSPTRPTISAWRAVEKKQHQIAREWWLITQRDHAELAGDLAAHLRSPLIPQLGSGIVRAIAVHDAGWARFDRAPGGFENARPISFLDVGTSDFLTAWRDSIAQAHKADEVGGLIVGRHFCRLAEQGFDRKRNSPLELGLLERFLHDEAAREQRLRQKNRCAQEELDFLTDVLQFCDLLSLYLCCGADDDVEFPQKFSGRTIRLMRQGELVRLEPPLFGAGISLGVSARRNPPNAATPFTTLAFLLH